MSLRACFGWDGRVAWLDSYAGAFLLFDAAAPAASDSIPFPVLPALCLPIGGGALGAELYPVTDCSVLRYTTASSTWEQVATPNEPGLQFLPP